MTKYSVNQHPVSVLLGWIESDNIAIPEMQRPFVWTSAKVRDLMDSLYRGFPVGYLITWQSPVIPVKGGGTAGFQQILIDGQQRVTALRAAISGEKIVTKRFETKRIIISFNPQTEEFETATPVLKKQPEWIYDIRDYLGDSSLAALKGYMENNPEADENHVFAALQKLAAIKSAPIGIISLNNDLDIETVTEIFVRINSKGVQLSSADFVMSKISANGEQGRNLRKLIDYFAHLSVNSQSYDVLANDEEFEKTKLWAAIRWLKDDTGDLYDPTYVDIIRVAAMVAFQRGRISSVVRELSGLDPETRKFVPDRVPVAYDKFEDALLRTVNEYDFKQYLMIIKSAGFIEPNLITTSNALNFTYALYLLMRRDKMSDSEIRRITRRWFVLMMLTGRASGSFESNFERDLERIARLGPAAVLEEFEQSELSDSFWKVTLPQRLNTSGANNPQFKTFLAAQVKNRARGFLSKHLSVQSMLELRGDIHHLVPKDYLRKNGVNDKRDYNQVANYALTESGVNVRIGNRLPVDYLAEVDTQIDRSNQPPTLGEINSGADLSANFIENAVPESLRTTTAENYEDFLMERRAMMAQTLRTYYEQL
ncbi:hypothetical protein CGLAR1_00325 [Corynebacterium glutamicum]|uniref:GmrSD restriction endonuclease domain-containing protein n=1 Tax=Corynebacterium glutamicum TaxID=1718 RepID=UPI0004F63812|nr:DUF262 domain-containing protein [Corynebacterium glutamicum]AIK83758.1 hypothetical protein CGLAR1_00325 [Corynebacterium glutamicum]